MISKFIVLICASLLSLSAFSYDREFYSTHDGEHIVYSYQEEGKWYLKEILIRPGELQEEVSSRVFESRIDLKHFKSKKYKKLKASHQKSVQFFDETELPTKSLWKVTEVWDLSWEEKFIKWLESDFDKDFFMNYKISTDCADAAFALRWIFSRIHGLPAANTMAGSHVLFTQDSMKKEWASLPTSVNWYEDELFLTGLKYILKHAFTGTLGIDGYPIKINPDVFRVGTIHLDGGHTMIISKIDYSGKDAPIWKLSSTVPSEIRVLYEEIMLDQSATDISSGGLIRMRWPKKVNNKWQLVAKNQMPYFSQEQYDPEFSMDSGSFTLEIIKRLGINFKPKVIVEEASKSVISMLNARVGVVAQGFQFCSQNNCEEGSFNYEEHSTPTRDKRIREKFQTIDTLVEQFSEYDETLRELWNNFQDKEILTIEGESKNIKAYRELFEYGIPSYHPDDSISERWALDEVSSISSLEKKAKRLFDKRTKLVTLASFCINNPACNFGTQNWNDHNTFELDTKMKNTIFDAYNYLASKYPSSPLDNNLEMNIKKIPGYISSPNKSLALRNGDHALDFVTLKLEQERLIQVENDLFIMGDKLIDLSLNNVMRSNLGDKLLLDDKNLKLYMLEKNEIIQLDARTGKIEYTLNLSESNSNLFSWFAPGVFVTSSCHSTQDFNCLLSFFQLENGKITKVFEKDFDLSNITESLSQNALSSQDQDNVLQFYDAQTGEKKLLFSDGEKLETILLNSDDELDQVENLGEKSLILYFGSYNNQTDEYETKIKKLDLASKNICEFPFKNADSLHFSKHSNFVVTTSYDDETATFYIFDDSCSITEQDSFNSEFYSFTELGETRFFEFDDSRKYVYEDKLNDLGDYTFIMKHTDYAYIYNISSQNITFEHLDFKTGNKRVASMDEIVYECGPNSHYYDCESSPTNRYKAYYQKVDEQILSYTYQIDDNDNLLMNSIQNLSESRFGSSTNIDISDSDMTSMIKNLMTEIGSTQSLRKLYSLHKVGNFSRVLVRTK